RRVPFEQPAKTVPIMETRDDRARFLLTKNSKDGRENSARANASRSDLEFIGFPVVRGDAMLLRPGTHDHRRPVRTARCGHHAASMKRVGTFLHKSPHN